jgi:sialate O-acetylesterase
MLLLLLLGLPTGQALSFASVFGDDQVLQRSVKAAVYGTGTPGTAVTVSVTDDSTGLVELTAPPVGVNAQGEWKALLPPHAAGTGFTVTASTGKSGIVLHRISFGDVWFCSGQSNMELPVYYTFTRNQSLDAVAAGKYDNIRLLHFDHNPLPKPAYVTNGSIATNVEKSSWLTPAAAMAATKDGCHGPNCQSELDAFSATCFYYGESLTDRMVAEAEAAGSGSVEPVPIGLIESAFGGTCIESWLGEEEQLQCSNITCTSNQSWAYTRDTQAACAAIPSPGNSAGSNAELFNGMVSPFVNMTLKGYLWCECAVNGH